MKVAFEEIGHLSATFALANGEPGKVCKMSASGTVTQCGDGDTFCGVIETARNGIAGVQLHGFAELPYTGSAPAVGFTNLQADAAGGIKAAGTHAYLVVSVDTVHKTAMIEL